MARFQCRNDAFGTTQAVKSRQRLIVIDGDIFGAVGVFQPRVFRPDAGIVEPGRDRMRIDDLPVGILDEVGPVAVKIPGVPADNDAAWRPRGEVDTSGYPEYNAVVGGVAAHWDEATGDLICRAVVGWGGKGVRGDTDRIGAKLLAGILSNIIASRYATGLTAIERPVPAAGRGGLVCPHCSFASAHERAFYCPKCGMRLLRG